MRFFRDSAARLVVVLLVAMLGAMARADSTTAPSSEKADEEIARLVKQLGDDDYFVRQRAQEELARYSFEAFEALSAAAEDKDLEVATRAKYLLEQMRVDWAKEDDPPQVQKILAKYGKQSKAGRISRMRALADLPGDQGVPALCRLVRYEKSPVLSKEAALKLIDRNALGADTATVVRRCLAGSQRPAALWLRASLRRQDDFRAAMADWSKLIDEESALLERLPDRTSSHLVSRLVRRQIHWLKEAGEGRQAVAAMEKLIELKKGDTDDLLALLRWLVEEKDWPAVERLRARFPTQFDSEPLLLYTLAGARLAQGKDALAEKAARQALSSYPDKDSRSFQKHRKAAFLLRQQRHYRWAAREYELMLKRSRGNLVYMESLLDCLIQSGSWKEIEQLARQYPAPFAKKAVLLYALAQARAKQGDLQRAQETANKAFQLNPGDSPDALTEHLNTVRALMYWGLFDWARREFQHVIEADAPGNEFARTARHRLAEMLHDQGQDREAADVLAELEKSVGGPDAPNGKPVGSEELDISRTLGETRARMHYFRARHHLSQGDRAKQYKSLEAALEANPEDVDVLIACFRFPDPADAFRQKVRKLIRESADRMRAKIAATPNDPQPHNQFAWLIGNTEGDLDEALRYSERSNQLWKNSGGYLDTLAHVYFAKGDYAAAVKTQLKAVELVPHSGVIRLKLEVFKKKLAEQTQQEQPNQTDVDRE